LLRTFDFGGKYILVSATAVGFAVNPQLPKAVTHMQCNLPIGILPSRLEGSDLDPRRWARHSDGTFAVVAPSVTMAKALAGRYRDLNVRTYLVTRDTKVSTYMMAAADYSAKTAYVLEPGVEAGVTLSVSVLVSMGAATAIRYDGYVVVEDTQPLDPIAAIQRGGRGGRVIPTLYLTPRIPEGMKPGTNSADYFRAQAIIVMVAMGANIAHWKEDKILDTFPRLKTLTRNLAIASIEEGEDPFIAVYKRNAIGQVYKECGGDGNGFKDIASQMILYHYAKGFFVGPIADFSDMKSDPSKFVRRKYQLKAAQVVVRSIKGLSEKYTVDDLVNMVIGKFDIYVNDIFLRLSEVFSAKQPVPWSLSGGGRKPEIADFLPGQGAIVKLFEHMATEPNGVRYLREDNNLQSKFSFKHGKKDLIFGFDAKYMQDGNLNTELFGDAVLAILQEILAVEILLNGASDRCCNLNDYRDKVPKEHSWFETTVRSSA